VLSDCRLSALAFIQLHNCFNKSGRRESESENCVIVKAEEEKTITTLKVYKAVQRVQRDNKKICWFQLRRHKNFENRWSKTWKQNPLWVELKIYFGKFPSLSLSLSICQNHTRKWKLKFLKQRTSGFGEIIQMRIVE
jgi:hypothetical protein